MDPLLAELWRKSHETEATLQVSALVNGRIVMGMFATDTAFTNNANELIEEIAENHTEDSVPSSGALRGLRFDEPEEDSDDPCYITLSDAILFLTPLQEMHIGRLRLDLCSVSAWWLRAPDSSEEDEPTDADEADGSVLDQAL